MRVAILSILLVASNAACSECSQTSEVEEEAVMSMQLLQTDRLVSKAKTEGGHLGDFANVKRDFSDLIGHHEQKKKVAPPRLGQEDIVEVDPNDAAAATGVGQNADDDIYAFISAIVANVGTIVGCVGAFIMLKGQYPTIYANNIQPGGCSEHIPTKPDDSTWGWLNAAWNTDTKDSQQAIGLDNALLLEFADLCMKILMLIGIPLVFIEGPLNCFFGGFAAGRDYMSYLSFGNVAEGHPWLYYVHAAFIWYVVIVVQHNIHSAQKKFIKRRYEWLRALPDVRANTVLVEAIPELRCSEKKVKEFFEKMMGQGSVKSVYVVKNTDTLLPLVNEKERKEREVKETKDDETKKQELMSEIKELENNIRQERKSVNDRALLDASPRDGSKDVGVNLTKAFVTFNQRRTAQIALSLQYDTDSNVWTTSTPPEARDILWADLTQDPTVQQANDVIGYALVVGLYFAYMPLVIGIANISMAVDMGPMQSAWEGLAPTMGLQLMVAFLPTILLLIFRSFFILKADAWSQARLQKWYFWFQVVFVILITAIGSSVVEFTTTLFANPIEVFGLLADTMPHATHFYMNFLVLQWTTHFMNLLRYVPLTKYMGFKQIYDNEEEARQMSEPEDQDYYGIGSRSARFAINMCIGIIYSTLSPTIALLAAANFASCRIVYGYLIPFAETKKADLGGVFWVTQLQHVFVGNFIYCILMTGVLFGRAPTSAPGIIVVPSIFYVLHSLEKFNTMYSWETLPFEIVAEDIQEKKPLTVQAEYRQPEMIG